MIKIKKSISDNRDIVGASLKNNIKYIMINDKNLTKSYVAVTINAGYYNDPKDCQGLAHFLEHMLFMGSSKYPDENYFMQTINEYGGYTNAFTDALRTTYFFNVFDNGLEIILDIFSRFFIDPLFNINGIKRETNAVDNEHKKNINNDAYRYYQFKLYLSNIDSNINTFTTGSNNTLNIPNIREKMIDFYNKYYTSDNMSLCIASSKSFDDILMMINHTFTNIPIKKKYIFTINKPFYNNNYNKVFFLKSSRKIYDINYLWEIPVLSQFYDSKDFIILQSFLLNKSNNSLYYELKKKGYLKYINIDISEEGIFNMLLSLSKYGYQNLSYINTIVYSYINEIFNIDIKKYAEYMQKILYINFNYNNKIDTESLCNDLSINHLKYNTENVIISEYSITKIKKTEEYLNLFKNYINNSKSLIIICSKKFINKNINYYNLREYNTNYGIINSNDITFKINKLEKTKLCCYDINNNYLDINIVITDEKISESPYLINNNLWFGTYSNNQEPFVYIFMQFNNNKYFCSPDNYILTHISINILNFLITTILYKPLELSYNLYFGYSYEYSSINLNISGPNNISKLYLLINETIDFILNIETYFNELSHEYINNLLIILKDNLKNNKYLTPAEYIYIMINNNIYSNKYEDNILLKYLKNIKYNDIKYYIKNLLNGTHINSLIFGNIKKNDININIFNKLNKYFVTNNFDYPALNTLLDCYIKHPNKKETNNCISFNFEIGEFTPIKYLLILLFINIYSDKFFSILRTKKQLGYIVSMNFAIFRDKYYIYQKIQSTKSLNYIIKQINKFNKKILLDVKNNFKNIKIDKYILSVKQKILEPENNLYEKYNLYLNEIISRKYLFNRKEILLNHINKLNLINLKIFILKYFNKKNKIIRIIQGNA
jgi:insulysin